MFLQKKEVRKILIFYHRVFMSTIIGFARNRTRVHRFKIIKDEPNV